MKAVITVLGLACLVVAALPAESQTPATYVGTPLCLRCHIDYARRWAALPHSQAMLAEGRAPEKTGCEACHGAGADHVAGNRKRIVRFGKLELDQKSAICLKCHEDKVTAERWGETGHSLLTSCDGCHEVHRQTERDYMLREKEESAECLGCHTDLPDEIKARRHHTLAEGLLPCNMCHNPHGTEFPRQLKDAQEKTCAACHDERPKPDSHQAAGWKLGHKDQAKGHQEECYVCHSEQDSCQKCHVVKLPHPAEFALEHKAEARQRLTACTSCHEADFCKQCHDDVPHPNEDGKWDDDK